MPQSLTGKVAFVTGGSRGIGRETAFELAARGASIAVADRKKELAEEVARECREYRTRASAFELDQASYSSVLDCIAQVTAEFDTIDLLFANAGTGSFAPLIDIPKQEWDLTIQINLSGTFYVCREVAKQMIHAQRGGRMVLTASSGARVIADQLGAYCVSKAGVMMLMKQLASELGNHRIAVNAVLPGVVETAMTVPMLQRPEWQRMLKRETPIGRWGQPADVAKVVAFLLSEDAAYINGEGIMIDGGSTLHGAPRWYATDYTRDHVTDWNECFGRYPYAD
jgi:NAD(P)-dependent dehydrogenase (short-subunit alcohol dehydrogenase family)